MRPSAESATNCFQSSTPGRILPTVSSSTRNRSARATAAGSRMEPRPSIQSRYSAKLSAGVRCLRRGSGFFSTGGGGGAISATGSGGGGGGTGSGTGTGGRTASFSAGTTGDSETSGDSEAAGGTTGAAGSVTHTTTGGASAPPEAGFICFISQ